MALHPVTFDQPYVDPVVAEAEHGVVVVLGPGFEMPLTPEAALESVERLRHAAEEAIAQREFAAGLSGT